MKVEQVQALFDKVQALYNEVYEVMANISTDLKSMRLSNEDMVDIGYLCREMENTFEDLRKEVKARKEFAGKLIAFNRFKDFVADSTISLTVHGRLATGTPDVKQEAELPKKGTPEYGQLLAHFNVPEALIEQGVVKPDWKAMSDVCTRCAAEGTPVPPGIGKTFPKYETTFRKKG